jgi:hypothetical protein
VSVKPLATGVTDAAVVNGVFPSVTSIAPLIASVGMVPVTRRTKNHVSPNSATA